MEERNLRKTRIGRVVSNKMDKTAVVAIEDSYTLRFLRMFEALRTTIPSF